MTQSYFPGSRQPITGVPGVPSEFQIPDEFGKNYEVNGEVVRFYTIGEVAEVLKRKPVTIRKWERIGTIPKAVYSKPGAGGDPRGRRRLYSKGQVEALLRIAMEENILHVQTLQISKTQFTPKVFAAFKELR